MKADNPIPGLNALETARIVTSPHLAIVRQLHPLPPMPAKY
ncbi:hypothetical protein [Laspinema palackyanum]